MSLIAARSGRPRWLVPVIVLAAVVLLVLLPLKSSYNRLVDKDTAVDRQYANIDVALQRRADLIPNLSAAVRAALGQERAVFGEIARARTQYGGASSPDARVAASNQLEGALARLLVIVEQYPQLQSNERIRDLMVQLEGTENRVAQERRDYNEVVTDYNRSVRRFPTSVIAGMFGFDKRTIFRATPGSENPPQVDLDPSGPSSGPAPTRTP